MAAADTAPADTGHSTKAATEYLVFEQHFHAQVKGDPTENAAAAASLQLPDGVWHNVGTVAARSAEHAIRQYAEKSGSTSALTLAAVASSRWVSATLKPSTVTTWETA